MLRGLLRLTWIELKVFMREPLGAIGSIVMPVLLYILFGRLGRAMVPPGRVAASNYFRVTKRDLLQFLESGVAAPAPRAPMPSSVPGVPLPEPWPGDTVDAVKRPCGETARPSRAKRM